MAVHDWARVSAGVFHDFHTVWIGQIRSALNEGLLPDGYYALAEQHAGEVIVDVLSLHDSPPPPPSPPTLPPATGGVVPAVAPPRARLRQTLASNRLSRPRTVAIRHVTGHRLIALLEVVSPANKDRGRHVEAFAEKAASALEAGVHVLMADLFPPGPHDPGGMHAAIDRLLAGPGETFEYSPPPGEPLTLAGYVAGPAVEAYLEHSAVGAALPDMPLFLRPDRYVQVPLEATYQTAWRGVPKFWREVPEGRAAGTG